MDIVLLLKDFVVTFFHWFALGLGLGLGTRCACAIVLGRWSVL